MVIFQYNLYIFWIHLRTVLYPKPCYNEPCYKEEEVLHYGYKYKRAWWGFNFLFDIIQLGTRGLRSPDKVIFFSYTNKTIPGSCQNSYHWHGILCAILKQGGHVGPGLLTWDRLRTRDYIYLRSKVKVMLKPNVKVTDSSRCIHIKSLVLKGCLVQEICSWQWII